MLCEVFAQAVYHLRFGFAFQKLVLQGEQGRSLHSVENGGFEGTVLIEEIFFDVCLCRIRHLLVLGSIATRGGSHIPHHGSIYHPIGSAQVVPVADGIRKRTLGRESQSATTFQRFVAQPVGPLVVTVLPAEGLVVILCIVDVVHKQIHSVPVLLNDLRVTKLFPYRPRHNDSGIGPTQTHFLIAVLCQGSHSGKSTQTVLGVAHVTHPLVEELHNVSKERTGFGKHLCVCCPAQALVALRTVGGYRQIVG